MREISRTSPSRRHPSSPHPTVIRKHNCHSRAGGNPNPRLPLLKATCESLEYNPTCQPISLHWERAGVAVKTAPPAPYNPQMGDFGRKREKNRKFPPTGAIRHPTTQTPFPRPPVIPAQAWAGIQAHVPLRLDHLIPNAAWSALALPNPAAQPKMASTLRLLTTG